VPSSGVVAHAVWEDVVELEVVCWVVEVAELVVIAEDEDEMLERVDEAVDETELVEKAEVKRAEVEVAEVVALRETVLDAEMVEF